MRKTQAQKIDDPFAQSRRERERTLAEKEKAWPRTLARMARIALNQAGHRDRAQRRAFRAGIFVAFSWQDFGRHIVDWSLWPWGTLHRAEYSHQLKRGISTIVQALKNVKKA